MPEPTELMKKIKIAKMKASNAHKKKTGLFELVAFFRRLSEFEKRSQQSNPLVG